MNRFWNGGHSVHADHLEQRHLYVVPAVDRVRELKTGDNHHHRRRILTLAAACSALSESVKDARGDLLIDGGYDDAETRLSRALYRLTEARLELENAAARIPNT